jgi:hypothetical protein
MPLGLEPHHSVEQARQSVAVGPLLAANELHIVAGPQSFFSIA